MLIKENVSVNLSEEKLPQDNYQKTKHHPAKNQTVIRRDFPNIRKTYHYIFLYIYRKGISIQIRTIGAVALRYFPSRRRKNDRLAMQQLTLKKKPIFERKEFRWTS